MTQHQQLIFIDYGCWHCYIFLKRRRHLSSIFPSIFLSSILTRFEIRICSFILCLIILKSSRDTLMSKLHRDFFLSLFFFFSFYIDFMERKDKYYSISFNFYGKSLQKLM